MKTILVPLGSSKKAINTLQYAVDFAQVSGAKIYVVQVFSTIKVAGVLKNMDQLLEEEGKQELAYILSKVDKKNVEIVSKPVKGQITDSIARIAKQLNVDLIIASAKHKSSDSSIYLGPITGGFVKQTELPILIIPKEYEFKPIQTVMLSIRSGLIKHNHILDPLQKVVSLFKSKVTLVHVHTPNNAPDDNSLNIEFEKVADEIINTENATVFQGVLEHLNKINPDMLCVIRNKRGFLNRLLELNSIKKVDFESRIPLLVLRGNL